MICSDSDCIGCSCHKWGKCEFSIAEMKEDSSLRDEWNAYRKEKREKEFLAKVKAKSVPIKTEKEISSGEEGFTPLHGLYAMFVSADCGGDGKCVAEKLNNTDYYTRKCIPALCFARWLVLNGYANFKFNSLKDSLVKVTGCKATEKPI